MSARVSTLRHVALAVGGGLITLAVLLTGITPVWLAVGPALLVSLDAIASSPAIRRQFRRVANSLDLPRRLGVFARRRSLIVEVVASLVAVAFGVALQVLGHPIGAAASGFVAATLAVWLALLALRPRNGLSLPAVGPSSALAEAWLDRRLASLGDDTQTILLLILPAPLTSTLVLALGKFMADNPAVDAQAQPDNRVVATGRRDDLERLEATLLQAQADAPVRAFDPILTAFVAFPGDGRTSRSLLAVAATRLTPLGSAADAPPG